MKERYLKDSGEVLYLYSGNTDAIKAAQSFFNEFGYTDGHGRTLAVDGDYGKNTFNAVIKYQRDNGLTVDGKLGYETWKHMWDSFEKKYGGSEQKRYAEREYNLSGMAVPKNEPQKKKQNNDVGFVAPFLYNNFNAYPSAESEAIKEERERQENMDEYIRKNGWSNYWTSGMGE